MQVLLTTWGGRGDVEPLVGLAERLRARGAQVRLCVPRDEDLLARSRESGAEVTPLGPAGKELMRRDPPPSIPETAAILLREQVEVLPCLLEGCDAAVITGALPAAAGALSAAEAAGVPAASVTFQQLTSRRRTAGRSCTAGSTRRRSRTRGPSGAWTRRPSMGCSETPSAVLAKRSVSRGLPTSATSSWANGRGWRPIPSWTRGAPRGASTPSRPGPGRLQTSTRSTTKSSPSSMTARLRCTSASGRCPCSPPRTLPRRRWRRCARTAGGRSSCADGPNWRRRTAQRTASSSARSTTRRCSRGWRQSSTTAGQEQQQPRHVRGGPGRRPAGGRPALLGRPHRRAGRRRGPRRADAHRGVSAVGAHDRAEPGRPCQSDRGRRRDPLRRDDGGRGRGRAARPPLTGTTAAAHRPGSRTAASPGAPTASMCRKFVLRVSASAGSAHPNRRGDWRFSSIATLLAGAGRGP